MIGPRVRVAAVAVCALALSATACSSSSSDNSSVGRPTQTATPFRVPPDVCAMLSTQDVSQAVGSTVSQSLVTPSPPSTVYPRGCHYAPAAANTIGPPMAFTLVATSITIVSATAGTSPDQYLADQMAADAVPDADTQPVYGLGDAAQYRRAVTPFPSGLLQSFPLGGAYVLWVVQVRGTQVVRLSVAAAMSGDSIDPVAALARKILAQL